MKNIQFLYLRSFSKTGGIEKFNKLFMLALSKIAQKNSINPTFISAYDTFCDTNYIDKDKFVGFDKSKILFTLFSVYKSFQNDITILGHINLSLVGLIIKIVKPKQKVFLVVHGIEVWQKQRFFKKWMLFKADKIISVSEFTKDIILKNYPNISNKFCIFPNTFDPLFEWPQNFEKPIDLTQKYAINQQDKILLTVSRLEYSEKYKGYDKVFETLPELILEFPNLKYFIIGKADDIELKRINDLVKKYKIESYVIILGYIPDNELIKHYLMADIFIMPSKKEGFGIVFIEAGLCGLQVIAGNKDASKEALINGKFGEVVNPDDTQDIANALKNALKNSLTEIQKVNNQQLIQKTFGFDSFNSRLTEILFH
ncbi:MAG: glycosyltransferase family 1 protein [Bacteroidetes bacterium]|nr:MAG: glycosyltransferase family 1 protein [Bacteroidota bacterium]